MTYFLDLFAGIGGFALGAEWAGLHFDGYYFSEVDPYAIKAYSKRFPDSIPLGDIRNIRGADLPEGDWIIAGGFPCQDISVAGKGAGLAGERSGLWFEYARIIGELRPKYAIMENVGALTIRGLDRVLGSLSALGYDAEWQDIRASDVGAPHRRERLWIVAYPSSSQCYSRPKKSRELCSMSKDWCKYDNPNRSSSYVSDATSKRSEKQGLQQRHDIGKYEICNRSNSFGRNWWSTEPDVGRVAHGIPSRVDRLKCLGNSIVPQIAELIFSQAAFDRWRDVSKI